ncbi:RNA polymerase sigma-70 factor [Chitinophaga sp. S165]|uniref:RNA polymerase sigma-70 factor n=1 Tax=Chitinophaga sp. S165 TaxID=2135462 RepID=UPI000D71CF99|nr:RNA polymerase sigma-70 factor [Chitinophaga sp. S165]PWV54316.1 RNA polymerase sigma-70 factor (ECF subfamily) [Chitinophaga sp. S165]
MEAVKESKKDSGLLEQYFFEYFEVLHTYAYTILKDNDAAKDVVQSVFIQLWQKREELNIKQSVRSYLYVATHNHCLNYIKSKKTRQRHYDQFASGEDESTTTLEESMALSDLKKEVLAAMKSLPEKCREIFYKSRFEEKSYAEIAVELNISVKTVEAQMGKALRILRTILSGKALFWLIISYPLLAEINKLIH